MDDGLIILVVILGLLALVLGWYLFIWTVAGAIILFGWAVEQGFIGAAAYIACWVFFLPVMVVISLIVGIVGVINAREEERYLTTISTSRNANTSSVHPYHRNSPEAQDITDADDLPESEDERDLGQAYYLSGRYDDAVAAARQSMDRRPGLWHGPIVLAAAQAQLGNGTEAIEAAQRLLQVRPFFTVDSFVATIVDPDEAAHMADGLLKAGLPRTATRE